MISVSKAAILPCALLGPALLMAGCNREAPRQTDDFAERIAATPAANGQPAPMVPQLDPKQVAAERERAEKAGAVQSDEQSESAVKGPYADLVVPPSVQSDAKAAEPCRAVAMSRFLGQQDSPALRQQVTAANQAPGGIRFVRAGNKVNAGEQPGRLNVMLDTGSVVRDFRCG
ncbi:hypothetical protein HNO88_003811 [Novosphingobium chloroacetimidivorans]|uniref:Lipoprotein n=1 Tax=Novosphingobium chloroacetimidivorans TaxID=1428314 RepID=A0A7W7NXA6_9SPHN|nr:hypothetical protein [Novosphingobium chloroacetimidivorans]MBB4860468.1 hypothetical protein [Novosphingobium chloroacetimidivorans]